MKILTLRVKFSFQVCFNFSVGHTFCEWANWKDSQQKHSCLSQMWTEYTGCINLKNRHWWSLLIYQVLSSTKRLLNAIDDCTVCQYLNSYQIQSILDMNQWLDLKDVLGSMKHKSTTGWFSLTRTNNTSRICWQSAIMQCEMRLSLNRQMPILNCKVILKFKQPMAHSVVNICYTISCSSQFSKLPVEPDVKVTENINIL